MHGVMGLTVEKALWCPMKGPVRKGGRGGLTVACSRADDPDVATLMPVSPEMVLACVAGPRLQGKPVPVEQNQDVEWDRLEFLCYERKLAYIARDVPNRRGVVGLEPRVTEAKARARLTARHALQAESYSKRRLRVAFGGGPAVDPQCVVRAHAVAVLRAKLAQRAARRAAAGAAASGASTTGIGDDVAPASLARSPFPGASAGGASGETTSAVDQRRARAVAVLRAQLAAQGVAAGDDGAPASTRSPAPGASAGGASSGDGLAEGVELLWTTRGEWGRVLAQREQRGELPRCSKQRGRPSIVQDMVTAIQCHAFVSSYTCVRWLRCNCILCTPCCIEQDSCLFSYA